MVNVMIRHQLMIFFSLVYGLTGCTQWHSEFNWAKPASLSMQPPPGSPEYQQGYVDGCNSGWKAYSTQFNKVWGSFKQDPNLVLNPTYYRVWKDAYAYCAAYANSVGNLGLMENAGDGKKGVLDLFGSTGDQLNMQEWRNPFDMNTQNNWGDNAPMIGEGGSWILNK